MTDLMFDLSIADKYKNSSQRSRVISEEWAQRAAYCPICGNVHLLRYANNKPVADFYCGQCKSDFELKAKQSKSDNMGKKVPDGAYDSMIERITSLINPHFFFLTYANGMVNNFFLVPNYFFTPDIIEKRAPLPINARRAGWVGCDIKISEIPNFGKIFIIKNSKFIDKNIVIANYDRVKSLKTDDLTARGWTLEVLNCVDRVRNDIFKIDEIYQFEAVLRVKYPKNSFIKDKIRQQLQILRDKGVIEFLGNGKYKKI